jgi:hypothetical protein
MMESDAVIQELVNDYTIILSQVYENKTVGDYTFEGVLYSFLMDLKKELKVIVDK